DEFVFILPMTSADGGQAFAQRLQERLRDAAFEPDGAGEACSITVSVGVADAFPYLSVETLLGAADTALYAAKDAGRDRVVMASLPSAA
ncbi:MAG TPA: diguanylate cyclase, partial [Dehalococcoidia bacterium]